MKNFYALLYIKSNVLTDELILFGMVANIEGQPYCYFSDSRFKLARKSLKTGQIKSFLQTMNMVKLEISELQKMPNALPLFDHSYSESILEKTAMYKKNMLVFSKPSEILEPKQLSIEKLVKVLFNETYHESNEDTKAPAFRSKWLAHEKQFQHGLIRKFRLKPEVIPQIFTTHQMDLIGLFEKDLVVFHSIDFSSAPRTIGRNIFEVARLIQALENFSKEKGIAGRSYYLVYEKPNKAESKLIFEKVLQDADPLLQFIELKDFEKVLNSLDLKGANKIHKMMT